MSEKTREIIHHLEWFTVLATILGGFFLLSNRMDNMDQRSHDMMQKQSERTDRLYEMFVDLLKERK